MRKAIALVMAATMIIMICGCAQQEVQAPTARAVSTDKPSETVERVPDVQQAERVPDQVAKTEAPTAAPAKKAETEVELAAETKTAEAGTQAASGGAKETQAAQAETRAAETKTATQEGDLVSTDYAPYAGKYTRTEDGSTFTLTKDGKVDISIIRLTQMDGKAEGIYKGIIRITAKDANDGNMGLEFNTETNELIVTDSKWSLLPNGETFKFDKKE